MLEKKEWEREKCLNNFPSKTLCTILSVHSKWAAFIPSYFSKKELQSLNAKIEK